MTCSRFAQPEDAYPAVCRNCPSFAGVARHRVRPEQGHLRAVHQLESGRAGRAAVCGSRKVTVRRSPSLRVPESTFSFPGPVFSICLGPP
jgi:hypothetical protein